MFGPQIRTKASVKKTHDRHHMLIMGIERRRQQKRARAKRGLVELTRPNLPVVVMMMMVVPVPTHLGRRSLRAFLGRGDAGGVRQRQRLSLLHWSSKNQHRTDGREAQNSRYLH